MHTKINADTEGMQIVSFHFVTITLISVSMIEVAVHHIAQMEHHALDSLLDRAVMVRPHVICIRTANVQVVIGISTKETVF